MLQELGFGESQFLEFGDFGAFKERLRSVAIEEIGQAGEGLPRVSGRVCAGSEILRGEWRLAYLPLKNSHLYQKRKRKVIGGYTVFEL